MKQRLARYLPMLAWARHYDRAAATKDSLAALIVTLMLIPQSLAYAMLAGLPPVTGLYASMLPLIAYTLFGTSRTLAVGPVAVVSLMTAAARAAVRPGQRGIRRSGHVAGAAFRRGAAAHGGAAPGLPGELPQPSGDFRLHQRVGHSHRPRPAQAHPRHLDRRRERRAPACRAAHGAAWGASADARHRWQQPVVPLSGPQPALRLAAASGHEPAYCRHADQDRPGRRPATGHRGGQRLRACRCRRAGRRRSTARPALAESANAGAGTGSAAVASPRC